jgi:hypothetical protein
MGLHSLPKAMVALNVTFFFAFAGKTIHDWLAFANINTDICPLIARPYPVRRRPEINSPPLF